MACKPGMAVLMTASGSLAYRKITAEISLKSTASRARSSTFATKLALSQITHVVSLIYRLKYCMPLMEMNFKI